VKLRLEGGVGTIIAIEGERIVLGITEVQRVEHHTDQAEKPDGWEMTADGAPVAIGPLHYLTGHVEAALDDGHAEELAKGLLEAVRAVRAARDEASRSRLGAPKSIVLPDGVRLRGDLRGGDSTA
jgi:hypothetical protein